MRVLIRMLMRAFVADRSPEAVYNSVDPGSRDGECENPHDFETVRTVYGDGSNLLSESGIT